MRALFCFLTGLLLLVYDIVLARELSISLAAMSIALIGVPAVIGQAVVPSLEELESKDHLTPLDKAWLGYHHYLSGPDA